MAGELQFNQHAQGSYIAQAIYGIATVNVYQDIPVRLVDSATLVAAQQQLASLPLNTLPDHAPLPHGSRMPFRPNPLFVGRETNLRALAEALKADTTTTSGQGKIAAATGLGGVGKTQLATEFVHRYGQYFAGGVFWLSFEDANDVPAQVAECGRPGYLGLRPDFDALPPEDQVRLVLGAWQSPLPRLLVFDNCENEALLDRWQPPTVASCVLVTSRRAKWNATLGIKALPLRELQRADSVRLLRKHTPNLRASDADLAAIASELGDLPLALHLAGSFLEQHPRTPAAYLALLRKTDPLTHRYLTSGGISPTGHEQHIGQTFAVSYNNLDRTKPIDTLALALLGRVVYFTPGEPISHDLLLATLALEDDSDDALFQAEDALNRLVELGPVEHVSEGNDTLRLHRLVAKFLRAIINDLDAQKAVEQGLARRYERIRSTSVPSELRIIRMDQLVGRMKSFAEQAVYTTVEIQALFSTGAEGNRIIALAIVSTKPDPSNFGLTLEAICHSRSAFEQYHALLAVRAMLPKLDEEQKSKLAAILVREEDNARYIRQSTSRMVVSNNILAALYQSSKIPSSKGTLSAGHSMDAFQQENDRDHHTASSIHTDTSASVYEVESGSALPLGATPDTHGVNFALFSEHATAVELLLFAEHNDPEPLQTIQLDPVVNRTFHFWHVYVLGVKPGMHYAYRLDGPQDLHGEGDRFNQNKVVLDPYTRGITTALWSRTDACTPDDNVHTSMRCVVIDTSKYDWEGDQPLRRPMSETIIYEMHAGGFTRSPSSGCHHPGTFEGIVEKILYLQELGVTAVELLPIFAFDEQGVSRLNPVDGKPLTDFWGYNPVTHFAPHPAYCLLPGEGSHIWDFREMVKALHKAGIEVILDVVFNHTSEGNQQGPTINFRGLDNSVYYMLSKEDKQYYLDYTGYGNTFKCNHPVVGKLIAECLEFWVKEMHVDGFRFDETSIMARDEDGNPMAYPPVVWHISLDETLADTKIIAGAWDAGGLYAIGNFPGERWAEWNGRFRDDMRRFVKGDPGLVQGL